MTAPADAPRLMLLTRGPGGDCHLCDEARDVVARVAAELRVGWHEVDVTADEDLDWRYAAALPVLLLDGVEFARWRVGERQLRAALVGSGH